MRNDDKPPGDLHSRIRRLFNEARVKADSPANDSRSLYGFSMRFTADGIPVFDEFGNVSSFGDIGYKEPITDVIEKSGEVYVLVELPGVKKEEIDLLVTIESVYIKVESPLMKYRKDVKLIHKVRPESTQAKFNNGVLEVVLRRFDGGSQGDSVNPF